MRDSYEFQAMLQEERNCNDSSMRNGRAGRPLRAAAPAAFTPLAGRPSLYASAGRWTAPDAEHFEAILASGWLGAPCRRHGSLHDREGQVFARCRTRGEWEAGSASSRAARDAPDASRMRAPRSPTSTVPALAGSGRAGGEPLPETVRRGRPFDRHHTSSLLDELSRLAPELMREKEREVLDRIREALLQVAEATSMP